MTIDLDFSFTYLPEASDLEAGEPRERYAWVCGGRGLSVRYSVPFDTPYGGGELTAERAVWGRRALSLHAADDRVEAGTVKGHPAILVHYADDKAGLGLAHIIVLEDDVGPEFTILRMSADNGISWPEFMKIAEGVA